MDEALQLYVPTEGQRAVEVDTQRMVARAVLATTARDRQGDVILVSGIDLTAHRRNPVVLVDHGKWYPLPIGKCRDPEGLYTVEIDPQDDEVLWQTTYFSQSLPLAEQLFGLIAEGILKGNSVGVRPIIMEDLPEDPAEGHFYNPQTGRAGRLIKRCELAEASWCAVPVNQEAAVTAVKRLEKSWGLAARATEPLLRLMRSYAATPESSSRRVVPVAGAPVAAAVAPSSASPLLARVLSGLGFPSRQQVLEALSDPAEPAYVSAWLSGLDRSDRLAVEAAHVRQLCGLLDMYGKTPEQAKLYEQALAELGSDRVRSLVQEVSEQIEPQELHELRQQLTAWLDLLQTGEPQQLLLHGRTEQTRIAELAEQLQALTQRLLELALRAMRQAQEAVRLEAARLRALRLELMLSLCERAEGIEQKRTSGESAHVVG